MCFKDLTLGDVLQILNMVVAHRKWIVHRQSGWQPINITLPLANSDLGVTDDIISADAGSGNGKVPEEIK